MNVTQKDIELIIEFDRALEKQIEFTAALTLSKKLEKPFKFSEASKKKMIRDVIKEIKRRKL